MAMAEIFEKRVGDNIFQYKKFKIYKGGGRYRDIYAPLGDYKTVLKQKVGNIARKFEKMDKEEINHAFMRYRNCVTNAQKHIGHQYTLSLDLTSFFDSVKDSMVKKFLTKEELELCFIDGIARQGLPTSPAIANLAFFAQDQAILKAFKKRNMQVIYTRYADDLTFSYDNPNYTEEIIKIVKNVCSKAGFKINEAKTKLQDAKNGRRIITGIGVDVDKVYPTRKILKKIRAAEHQNNIDSLQGLREWAKCKVPNRNKKETADDLHSLAKMWKKTINKRYLRYIPEKETIKLSDNCFIDGDPIMMLGMSDWTTGWTSCMSRKGQYKKGVPFWIFLKGTRIAYIAATTADGKIKKMRFGSIERPKMVARCLVHELRNGVLVYDRLYGNNTIRLEEKLREYGCISIAEAKEKYEGEKVVGNVATKIVKIRPYLDNLHSGKGKRKGTDIDVWFLYV